MPRRLCLLLLLAAPALCLAASPFPGGVLDPSGRTAYLASEAGIDALDLAHGELLWQSREANLPLLVAADRLYALALSPDNSLAVVALGLASKPAPVFRSEVHDFPRWAATLPSPTQSFHLDWRQRRGTLLLDWQAEARPHGSPAKHAAGRLQVDLDSGRVEPAPLALPAPRAPEQVPLQLEKLAVRWQSRAGGQLLVVAAEELPESKPGDRKQRLVLRGWDARSNKETTPPRELLRGGRLVLLTDLDGKHLWLRDAAGHGQAPWHVVSGLDGNLVRHVPFVPGTKHATLVGSRAYCMATAPARGSLDSGPRRAQTLHAIDLESGKVVWQRPLGVPAHGR